MGRPRKTQPGYRYHAASRQAVVTFNGKNFFLGEFESPQSYARYYALCHEYLTSGFQTPVSQEGGEKSVVTVADVAAEARAWADKKFAKNPAQHCRIHGLADLLADTYGPLDAEEFGPVRLGEVRSLLLLGRGRGSKEAGSVTRSYVNMQVRNVVRIFKHAASRELVSAHVLVRLETLESLRADEGGTESKPVIPVSIEDVAKTIPFLSETLRAMVRIQLATGMRPSEVIKLRPQDIDKSGSTWMYRPASHKTKHKGKSRAVPIVGEAREALAPFLDDRDSDAFCFSPKESAAWYRKQRSEQSSSKGRTKSKATTKRNNNPKRLPGEKFTKDSYRRAVERAAKRAKVTHWFPYQLRHTTATEVRNALGVEAAQALLGHSRISTTEIYTQRSEAKAIEAANSAPRLGK